MQPEISSVALLKLNDQTASRRGLKFARRLTVLHPYADDFVADAASTVSRAVLSDEGVVSVLLLELVTRQ